MLLKQLVNSAKRNYFIEDVNEPLVKDITILGNRYPEPTHENVAYPNSHRLLDIRDEFFKHWDFGKGAYGRNLLFKVLFRILIVKYEHSPSYRNMLDWFVEMTHKNWKPFNPTRQMRGWRE